MKEISHPDGHPDRMSALAHSTR